MNGKGNKNVILRGALYGNENDIKWICHYA